MFKLHHLNNSRSQRILWMLELLGTDYEIEVYKRDNKTNLAPDSLKAIHPLGTAPILTHNGKAIAETGAICEYLVQQTQDTRLIPEKSSEHYIDVQFWSHYAEGSFTPHLVTAMVLNKGKEKAKPFFIKFVVDKFVDAIMDAYFGMAIKRNLNFVEEHLKGRQWLVGDSITVADIQMSFPLEAMNGAGKLDNNPNIQQYVKRFQSDPDYQQAMSKMKEAEIRANGNN